MAPTDGVGVARAVRQLEDDAVRAALVEKGKARAARLTPETYVRDVMSFLDEFELTRRCWA